MVTRLPHITDDHHFAIANVAARASQMEIHIEKTIAKAFLNQPKTAEFLLKNLGSDRLVKLLNALLLDLIPEETESIDNLTKEIEDLRSERNEILHRTWIPGLQNGEAISASARPFREFRWASKNPGQIQKVADLMGNVVHALMEWQQLLHGRLAPPSP